MCVRAYVSACISKSSCVRVSAGVCASARSYELAKDGHCARKDLFIDNMHECQYACRILGLSEGSTWPNEVLYTDSALPSGCYLHVATLNFNPKPGNYAYKNPKSTGGSAASGKIFPKFSLCRKYDPGYSICIHTHTHTELLKLMHTHKHTKLTQPMQHRHMGIPMHTHAHTHIANIPTHRSIPPPPRAPHTTTTPHHFAAKATAATTITSTSTTTIDSEQTTQLTPVPTRFPPPTPACNNTNGILRDWYGDDCAIYDWVPSQCGKGDSSAFEATRMCCACGGGTDWRNQTTNTTGDVDTDTDATGVSNNCSWVLATNTSDGCARKRIDLGHGASVAGCGARVRKDPRCGNGMLTDGDRCQCEEKMGECEGSATNMTTFSRYTNTCPGTVVCVCV